ncbi:metallophosphoesterase [Qipengyuania sp. RANM35]|uniref:metallophosphoesterase n=1 Tax=Qipengyuania sp. RANM35 TaxID=3068635 RepID=UPI0034DAF453
MRGLLASVRRLAAILLLASMPAIGMAEEQRVVAVGDLHGDYGAWLEIARASGASTDGKHWTGGRSVLVQMGDIVDRGPDSLKIIRHLQTLDKEAAMAGGRVVVLLGNHEAMNVIGDLRYVDPGEYAAFVTRKSDRTRKKAWQAMAPTLVARARTTSPDISEDAVRTAWLAATPLGLVEHRHAWAPGGELGKWAADRPATYRLGDTLFVHGGISLEASVDPIERINARYEAALEEGAQVVRPVLEDPLGPLWYRGNVAGAPDQGVRPAPDGELATVLARLGAARLVVGHTPNPNGITEEQDGRLIRIDTGISRAYGGPASFLEILGGQTWAHERGKDGQWSRRALQGVSKAGER